jgi:hypothetical protein
MQSDHGGTESSSEEDEVKQAERKERRERIDVERSQRNE